VSATGAAPDTGGTTTGPLTGGGEAVLGAADIARLSGVRRPAVSNWRRRYSDFPRPMSGSSANPMFSMAEVEQWCLRNGKPFRADPAERLWQRIRATVDGVRTAEFLAHAGLLLTRYDGVGPRVPGPDAHWAKLLCATVEAAEADPDGAGGLYARLCDRLASAQGRSAAVDAATAAAVAEIAGIGPGMRVLDPACGSGPLLRAAAERGAEVLWAQDLDPALTVVCRSRLLLAGTACEAAAGDALREDGFADREADAVLCDPPFRDRDWGHDELEGDGRWSYGHPPRGEGELAWVQHCLARVRRGGTVVVRMPAAAAGRASGRRVRAALLAGGALRMVAELPGGDGPSTAHLWVLRRPRNQGGAADRIVFVHGVKAPDQIVHAWMDPAVGGAAAVAPAELMDAAVDLRPAVHVAPRARDRAEGYPALRAELVAALTALADLPPELHAPSDAAEAEPDSSAPTITELAASGIVEIHQAPLGTPAGHGPLPLLTHRDLRDRRPPGGRTRNVPGGVVVRPGDVVAASGGHPLHPRVAGTDDAGAVLGPRLVLIRTDPDRLDPGYLAGVLEGAAASAERTGASGTLRFDLRRTRVPMITPELQRARAAARRRLDATEDRVAALADLGRRLAELGRLGLSTGTLLPRTTEEAP
jgi:SAM-dependent methyltransferase